MLSIILRRHLISSHIPLSYTRFNCGNHLKVTIIKCDIILKLERGTQKVELVEGGAVGVVLQQFQQV